MSALSDLRTSCINFSSYPENLLNPQVERELLRLYKKRLAERKDRDLFEPPSSSAFKIPVRDIGGHGPSSEPKQNILDIASLGSWLGDLTLNPDDSSTAHKDPLCRFVYLVSPGHNFPLELSKEALQRIFSYHQIEPWVLDFLFVYGKGSRRREARYNGFRTESTIKSNADTINMLRRSNKQYHLCYDIKSVSQDEEGNPNDIVVRHATIYHQFDVRTKRQLWIIGDPHAQLKRLLEKEYPPSQTNLDKFDDLAQGFKTSLNIHSLFIRWAQREGRSLLHALDTNVDKLTATPLSSVTVITLENVQFQVEKLKEAAAVLRLNDEILSSLQDFYSGIVKDLISTITLDLDSVSNDFNVEIGQQLRETRMLNNHINTLVRILEDRQTAEVFELQNRAMEAQEKAARKQEAANDRQERLNEEMFKLTEESVKAQGIATKKQEEANDRQELLNKKMFTLTQKSQKEAVTMRIITVITLLYLPATFVSTFFSTDVIKFQPEKAYSKRALGAWFGFTLPLLFMTAGGAWWYDRKKKQESTAGEEEEE
ncbi:hypothetical protein QBC38DRAFT_493209 [Podospora fimiseda]|uniref:CorA-like transporter domain-containing protein n=1 Tax=Podospora fimiseda TaxID=252190 RepID=A0AAN7BEY4_9PEZI|nr:hypothetical protein QBC38DRAFT_493209 [Podospora fimiseda]